jgi:hypothetical protein
MWIYTFRIEEEYMDGHMWVRTSRTEAACMGGVYVHLDFNHMTIPKDLHSLTTLNAHKQ